MTEPNLNPIEETEQVLHLLKRQKEMLGHSLVSLDLFLYLHKNISRLHIQDIKPILVEKLPYILRVRYFSIFMFDSNKRELTLACSNHLDTEKEITLHQDASGVMNDALTQMRYIFEPDFTQSKYFKGKRNARFKNNFFLCVPLMIENKILGVINLNDSEKGFISVSDLDYILSVLEFVALSLSNALLHEKTEVLSVTDGLTRLYDHRYMIRVIESEFERSRRYGAPLSLLMMDIDHFKKVNDSYGHQKGDEVLIAFAGVMNKLCRNSDTAARYGGEEFVVVLPQTRKDGAMVIAERIRKEMADIRFPFKDTEFSVSVSCGLAELNLESMKSPADLIHSADTALYKAKQNGRDRTEVGE